MKIGIATCAEKPNLTPGDRALAACLEAKGARVSPLIWNESGILEKSWDAIILRSTWDYHRHPTQFLEWLKLLENASIKLINPAEIVRWNLDKSYLLELEAKGLSIVPTLLIPQSLSESEVLERIKNTGWTKLVLKPTISATAFLTFNTQSLDVNLPQLMNQVRSHSDLIVQPFLPSIILRGEVSFIFFNDKEIHYSHSVLKKPQKNDFRVQSDFGGSVEAFEPSTQLLNSATACAQAIRGDWTFARVDIVDYEQTPLLSELELIEPDLFLSFHPQAPLRLANAVATSLKL